MNNEKIKSEVVKINNDLKIELDNLKDTNFKLTNNNIELAKQLAEVKESREEFGDKIAEQNRQLSALRGKVEIKESIDTDIDSLKNRLNEALLDVEDLTKTNQELVNNLSTAHLLTDAQERVIKKANIKIDELFDDKRELNEEIKSIKYDKDELESKFNRLISKVSYEYEHSSIDLEHFKINEVLEYISADNITIEQVEKYAEYCEVLAVYKKLKAILYISNNNDNLNNK